MVQGFFLQIHDILLPEAGQQIEATLLSTRFMKIQGQPSSFETEDKKGGKIITNEITVDYDITNKPSTFPFYWVPSPTTGAYKPMAQILDFMCLMKQIVTPESSQK